VNIASNGDHISSQFMAEKRGWHDHASVVAAAEDLHVGAAGQRRLHPNKQVSRSNLWYGDPLYCQMLFAIEHGSHHLRFHLRPPLWLNDYF
jgi:hypothetical protein